MKPISNFEEYWDMVPEQLPKVIEKAVKDHTDVPPLIIPAKDGHILAYINPIGDRDQYLKIMQVVIQGMEPDELMFVTDAYVATSLSKHDGTPWVHGEMEKAYLDMTVDSDLVSENVNVMRIDRLGNVAAFSLDYRRNEDNTTEFGQTRVFNPSANPDEEGLGGYIVDKLREYFNRETYRQYTSRNGISFLPDDMTEEEFVSYTNSMIIKQALIPLGCSVLLMINGQENAGKVFEFLKDGEEQGEYKVMDEDEYEKWIGEFPNASEE